jgi:hypothetical protein
MAPEPETDGSPSPPHYGLLQPLIRAIVLFGISAAATPLGTLQLITRWDFVRALLQAIQL